MSPGWLKIVLLNLDREQALFLQQYKSASCAGHLSLFSAPAHGKARTSRLCCVQSLPLPRHPRNQEGHFGGRLWICIYSLESQCCLSRNKTAGNCKRAGFCTMAWIADGSSPVKKPHKKGLTLQPEVFLFPRAMGVWRIVTQFLWLTEYFCSISEGLGVGLNCEWWLPSQLCVWHTPLVTEFTHTEPQSRIHTYPESCWHPQCIIKIIWDSAFLSLAQLQPRKGPKKSLCP